MEGAVVGDKLMSGDAGREIAEPGRKILHGIHERCEYRCQEPSWLENITKAATDTKASEAVPWAFSNLVLQPSKATFDAGISQSDGFLEKAACRQRKARRDIAHLRKPLKQMSG